MEFHRRIAKDRKLPVLIYELHKSAQLSRTTPLCLSVCLSVCPSVCLCTFRFNRSNRSLSIALLLFPFFFFFFLLPRYLTCTTPVPFYTILPALASIRGQEGGLRGFKGVGGWVFIDLGGCKSADRSKKKKKTGN